MRQTLALKTRQPREAMANLDTFVLYLYRAQRQKIMKAKATRLEIKRQQQEIRAKEVAREKTIHDEKVR